MTHAVHKYTWMQAQETASIDLFDFSGLFSVACDEIRSKNASCGVKGPLSASINFRKTLLMLLTMYLTLLGVGTGFFL